MIEESGLYDNKKRVPVKKGELFKPFL